MAHALDMLGGRMVAKLRGNGEPLNSFLTRQAQLFFSAFQAVQRLLQREGSCSDDVLEVLTMEAIFHLKPSAAESVGDVDENFIGFERLDDISKRTDLQGGIGEDRAIEARDHDRRRVCVLLEDVPHEIHAGFSRHIDVAEHQCKGLVGQLLPGFSGICSAFDRIPMGLKQVGQQSPDRLFVIDHQDIAIIEEGLMSGLVQQYRHESECSRIVDAVGCLGFFFIGLLAVDLNAVGTAERCALFVPIVVPSLPPFNTVHFDDLKRSRTGISASGEMLGDTLVRGYYLVSTLMQDYTSKDCTESVKL